MLKKNYVIVLAVSLVAVSAVVAFAIQPSPATSQAIVQTAKGQVLAQVTTPVAPPQPATGQPQVAPSSATQATPPTTPPATPVVPVQVTTPVAPPHPVTGQPQVAPTSAAQATPIAAPPTTPQAPVQSATPPAAPPQPATVQPSTVPISAVSTYRPGSIVSVYPLESEERGPYKKGQPIGSFVTVANPLNLGLHLKEDALAFFKEKPLGYEADAYFVAKATGNYSFSVQLALPPTSIFADTEKMKKMSKGFLKCRYRLFINDVTIIDLLVNTKKEANEKERICGFNGYKAGSVQLSEGVYKLQQWFACVGERKLKKGVQYVYPEECDQAGQPINTDRFLADEAEATLRVRHPKDSAPALLKPDELVHKAP